jgi:phospholipid/cholesterol/gamma-HCH transport system permease protein
MKFFDWIGRHFIDAFLYVTDLTFFLMRTLAVWQPHRNVFNRVVYYVLIDQLILIGINALAIISLLAMLVGVGVTSQLIFIIQSVTGADKIIEILSRLVLSELGPLITGFILIGRSCSAIVVDLGNTRVSGEIEPLEYLGIDIDDYFVIPRILCMVISQMVLALYFTAVTILCGALFSAFMYDFSAQESLNELLSMISLNGLLRFMLKNFFIGLVVGAIACFQGLLVKNSHTQVSEQMQKAVVRSIIFLYIADGYFMVYTL